MVSVCAVVPVYDHQGAIRETVAALRGAGLEVFMVDDGSGPACASLLREIAAGDPGVRLTRLDSNQGKGAAVVAGLGAAAAAGHTHALQIDADGQHDASAVPRFVAAAVAEPGAVICARPVFDASIPRARLVLRYLTHAMVWLNTLSLDIPDSMCGFRVYPLPVVLRLVADERPGRRMDFDIELLVRLNWSRVPMRWLPLRVGYPADGVSHFRLVRDNALITAMHVRLFLGMLWRSPGLIARRAVPAPLPPDRVTR